MEVLIIPLIIALGLDGKSSAATAAARAYAKQSGAEVTIENWQRLHLGDNLRARLGEAAWLTKTITEQRITFRLEFP